MTKDEMIRIASDAAEAFNAKDGHLFQKWFWDRTASVMVDALIAAGVIPVEGTIPIARTTLLEWREVTDRLPCHLSEMIDIELWINTHDDAIPAAPTGEGEA